MELLANHIHNNVFCNKIIPSSYQEVYNISDTFKLYPNIIELLFSYYDHHYTMVKPMDKKLYIKQLLIRLATDLEEKKYTLS